MADRDEEIIARLRRTYEAFSRGDFDAAIELAHPEGNKVLVRQHARARGAGSGIELDIDSWVVWTMDDDGLATRLEFYLQHQEAEALEAAGPQ